MMKKADLIIDLQYGSTGKGLIAGYLGATRNYDMVINANMPNAGHTYIDANGQLMMHKVLPNGLVSPNIKYVMIGPGSIFDLKQLEKEMAHTVWCGYSHYHLVIHENAVVLQDEHKNAEQESDLSNIGSTKQGTSAAMIEKIMRGVGMSVCAKHALIGNGLLSCVVTNAEWMKLIAEAENVLIEGAQGFSLGINAGFYPYCTSRDCTPARFMADCGVPLPYLRRVIGTARMHPIRVGGTSGGFYPDQEELTWEELGQPEERTTVTQRVRRVFTWSQQQIEEALMACMPDEIFLNFCNYDSDNVEKIKSKIRTAAIKAGCAAEMRYTGWGANHNDVRENLMNPYAATEKERNEGHC